MQRSLATVSAAALLAGSLSAQGAVGAYAPEFEARDWYNAPPGTSLQELRGKVVFLVFWATW